MSKENDKVNIVPCSYIGHKTAVSGHQLTFNVDNTMAETINNVALYPKGKNVVLVVISVEDGDESFKKLVNEGDMLRNSLMSRVHAIISQYSRDTEVNKDKVKEVLKMKMIARGIKKESMSDYTEHEVSTAIHVLMNELEPYSFNWLLYK
jgi:hypothetical protein